MKMALSMLVALLLSSPVALASDAFDKVRCGSDVPKALAGAALPNGTVAAIEAAHKAINLKDLGADEVTDHLQLVSWSICGAEYKLLVDDHDRIRDVLPFPAHSRSEPEFGGSCQAGKTDGGKYLIAILDNRAGLDANTSHHYAPDDATLLPAEAAWKIDEKQAKFAKIDATGLRCARSGIITVDGGP